MSESLPLPNWGSRPQHVLDRASLHAAASDTLSHRACSRPPSFLQGPGSEDDNRSVPHRGRLDSSTNTSSIVSGWHREDEHTPPRSEEGLPNVGTAAWVRDQHSYSRSGYAAPEFHDMPSCGEGHKQQSSRDGSRGSQHEVPPQRGSQTPPRSASTTRTSIQTRRASNTRSEPRTHPASSYRTYVHHRPGDSDMDAPHPARSARRTESVYTGTNRASLLQEYYNRVTSLASIRYPGRQPHDGRTASLATVRRSRPRPPRRRRGFQLLWKRRVRATRCIAISWLVGFALVIVLIVVLIVMETAFFHKKKQ